MVSEGTTPRRLTDLIGSLCDLTSGSGDKGTPIVYIQGYFDNYSNDWTKDKKQRISQEMRCFLSLRCYSARFSAFSIASAAGSSHAPSNSSILPASTRAASFGSMGIWASRGME